MFIQENTEDYPDMLQEVDLEMIPRPECQDYFGGVRKITDNMICGYTAGKDSCQVSNLLYYTL